MADDFERLCPIEGPVPGGRVGVGFDLPGCPIIWTHPNHPPHIWRGPSAGFVPVLIAQAEEVKR